MGYNLGYKCTREKDAKRYQIIKSLPKEQAQEYIKKNTIKDFTFMTIAYTLPWIVFIILAITGKL